MMLFTCNLLLHWSSVLQASGGKYLIRFAMQVFLQPCDKDHGIHSVLVKGDVVENSSSIFHAEQGNYIFPVILPFQ